MFLNTCNTRKRVYEELTFWPGSRVLTHHAWIPQTQQELTQWIGRGCMDINITTLRARCTSKHLATKITRWIKMKMCPVAPEGAESACKSVFVMTSLALSCLNSWLRPVQLAHRPLTPATSVLFVWAEKQLLSHCAICAFIARWH